MSLHRFMLPMSFLTVFGLVACIETPQAGLPAGAQAKYPNVAVVADVSDQVVSTYWSAALSEPKPTDGRLGWNASAATAELVREQLSPAGARVVAVSSPTNQAAKANSVALVLRQAPLNKLGQNYNPGRDFLMLGGGIVAIAAIAGAEETKDKAFQPRFVLWLRNPAASKAMIGENACTVGLAASLVDPVTGEALSAGTQITGRTIIPGALTAPDWANLPKDEKARVLAHCKSALRSAVSQALQKLDVLK